MKQNPNFNHPVDAVITWVNSSDENWRNKIDKYSEIKINWDNKKESVRYNSINEIEITILSILKNATFIKNIYLVTDNQQPKNFHKLQEKAVVLGVNLKLIDHKVIFRGYEEYLPTFNSQTIETMLYRIPNLAEHFIYFNDDLFLINKTKVSDFFINGFTVLRGEWIKFNEDIFYKNIPLLKKKKNKVTHKRAKEKAAKIIGFTKSYNFHHTPHPLRKSTFERFFDKNPDIRILNIEHRFRHVAQYVPQGLANHLEIKNKTHVLENNLALCYLQSYNFFKVRKKIIRANFKGNKVLFMCLQGLETANKNSFKYLLKWINKKLDLNFKNES